MAERARNRSGLKCNRLYQALGNGFTMAVREGQGEELKGLNPGNHGRSTAVSCDVPDNWKAEHVKVVRHCEGGDKFAFNEKFSHWKTPWNLPCTYNVSAKAEPVVGGLLKERWQKQDAVGDSGVATAGFRDAYRAQKEQYRREAEGNRPTNPTIRHNCWSVPPPRPGSAGSSQGSAGAPSAAAGRPSSSSGSTTSFCSVSSASSAASSTGGHGSSSGVPKIPLPTTYHGRAEIQRRPNSAREGARARSSGERSAPQPLRPASARLARTPPSVSSAPASASSTSSTSSTSSSSAAAAAAAAPPLARRVAGSSGGGSSGRGGGRSQGERPQAPPAAKQAPAHPNARPTAADLIAGDAPALTEQQKAEKRERQRRRRAGEAGARDKEGRRQRDQRRQPLPWSHLKDWEGRRNQADVKVRVPLTGGARDKAGGCYYNRHLGYARAVDGVNRRPPPAKQVARAERAGYRVAAPRAPVPTPGQKRAMQGRQAELREVRDL
jgi:hypothetical protein